MSLNILTTKGILVGTNNYQSILYSDERVRVQFHGSFAIISDLLTPEEGRALIDAIAAAMQRDDRLFIVQPKAIAPKQSMKEATTL